MKLKEKLIKLLKKINKEKLINVLMVLIVIALYVAVALFIYSNFRERKRQEISNGIIEKIDEIIEENEDESITEAVVSYGGFNFTVLGKLRIKKINLYEPILKENTASAYNTALVKMSGPDLNENGNVAIGGHNYMRGNYFLKINKLVENDVVTVIDLTGRSIDYYVYEYGVTTADDASYLAQPDDDSEKIITLVTCTKGGKQRYYVKAKAK